MDIGLKYNTEISLKEDWVLENIPPTGYLAVNYEVQHKGDVKSGAFRDVSVRLSSPKKFSHAALKQVRKYPRYYARRFNLWWLFSVDDNYREHLRSLSARECRALDELHNDQDSK